MWQAHVEKRSHCALGDRGDPAAAGEWLPRAVQGSAQRRTAVYVALNIVMKGHWVLQYVFGNSMVFPGCQRSLAENAAESVEIRRVAP